MTYSADQLEKMPKKRLAALRKLVKRPRSKMKTVYPKTGTRRRRKTFADGSHVIVSSSGYEIFEGITKSKTAKLKLKPRRSPSSL